MLSIFYYKMKIYHCIKFRKYRHTKKRIPIIPINITGDIFEHLFLVFSVYIV